MISLLLAAMVSIAPSSSRAADAAPAAAPIAAPSVAVLKDRFIEAEGAPERTKILNQLALTLPVSGQDVSNLFDLFTRFTDDFTRKSVMASLSRLILRLADNLCVVLVGVETLDRRNVERRRQIIDNCVEQRLHALVLEGRAAKNGIESAGQNRLADHAL